MERNPETGLSLRPTTYPQVRAAFENTWTVEEADLHSGPADLAELSPPGEDPVRCLVASLRPAGSVGLAAG